MAAKAALTSFMATAIQFIIAFTAKSCNDAVLMDGGNGTRACDICDCYYTEKGLFVDCSSRNLTQVPPNIDEGTYFLNLSNNHIKILDETVFQSLIQLKSLSLRDNKIQHLPVNIFKNASRLQSLYLDHNRLAFLQEELLQNVTNLQSITLQNNQLLELSEGFLAHNKKLVEIDISTNSLSRIPENTFTCNTKLEMILLSGNRFQYLPMRLFEQTTSLTTLTLNGNDLLSLPDGLLVNLCGLQLLSLQQNKINHLPVKIFEDASSLQVLYLDHNRLEFLHKELLRNITILRSLTLHKNQLRELPENFLAHNKELVEIDISGNFLSRIPEEMFTFNTKLKLIRLIENRIQHLPMRLFEKTTSLETLYLDGNDLLSLPEALLVNLCGLQLLSLRQNKIQHLPTKIFEKTPSLQYLYLDQNRLEFLQEKLLQNVTNLQTLTLHQNQVRGLPGSFLAQNNKLAQIDISANFLSRIPEDMFAFNTELVSIVLDGNELLSLPETLLLRLCNLQVLSLSQNKIQHLPVKIFENASSLQFLYLDQNRLEFLQEDLLRNVTNLQSLMLQENQLRELPESFLTHNKELIEFNISENLLSRIPENTFTFNSKLFWISSTGNKIQHLPLKIFENASSLQYVYLHHNRLESLQEELLQNVTNLQVLTLHQNQLRELPESFLTQNNKLVEIHLDRNDLEHLPLRLFEKTAELQSLTLFKNSLRELPERIFANNGHLQNLDISHNLLGKLEENTFCFPNNLELINLSFNKLEFIPEKLFSNTPRLKYLYLNGNNLKSIQETLLERTPHLEILAFDDNIIQKIPSGLLDKTPKLQQLYLQSNQLLDLPEDILKNVLSLKSLILQLNKISLLPENLFSDVVLAGMLELSFNNIEKIPSKLFSFHNKSHDLQELFLQRNRITYIQSGLFLGLPNLTTLCLFDNQIQLIESTVFATTSVKIYLFGNRMENFTYSSFKGRLRASEIHLYGNNITALSGNATNKGLSRLYINCDQLQDIHGIKVKMSCVGPKFIPTFSLAGQDQADYIASFFGVEGFSCTLSNVTHHYSCELCPQGTYSNGRNKCIPCPKGGFYQDEIGSYSYDYSQFLCKKCENGTYVNGTGGTSQKDCIICPDGTNKSIHAGFRACFCKDEFARRGRFDKCFHCKQQGLKCAGQDFESLEPGYFWDWNFPNASIDEFNLFAQNLLNETRFYDNRTNYSKRIPRVHKCPRTASCVNNFTEENSVATTCALGYAGWLCNKCLPGYYSVYSSCLRCPDVKMLVLGLLLILCVSSVILYSFWLSYAKQRKEGKQRNTVDIVVSRIKIMLGFYQVTGQYLSSFNSVNLDGTMRIIGEIITALEINMIKLFIRPQCFDKRLVINPKVEFIIAMTALFAFTSIPCLLYKISKVYFKVRYQAENPNERISNLKGVTLYFVVALLFITYPPTCTSIFQIFPGACQSFCLDFENRYCFTALRSDYDVRCDKQLIVYQVFAVMTTVGYVMAFPLALFYLLKKHCSAPFSQDSKERNSTMEKHETTVHSSTASRHRNLPQYLKFLCENYKSNYWYWEIVELARKVTQTILITMLGWENKFTVLLTIGISVLFLTLNARYRPMKSVREQGLQMFSLIAILTNVVFIAVKMPDKYKDVLSWFLIFLNISLILVVTLEVLFVVIIQLKVVLLQWWSLRSCQASKGRKRLVTQRMEKAE